MTGLACQPDSLKAFSQSRLPGARLPETRPDRVGNAKLRLPGFQNRKGKELRQ